MPYILIGQPCFELYSEKLHKYGFTPISLPPDTRTGHIVRTHADTLIWSDGVSNTANRDYLDRLPALLRPYMAEAPDFPGSVYPDDTVFNAIYVGRYLFAKLDSLSSDVRRIAKAKEMTLINVKQGYARCSTLALPAASAAITADEGMAKAMEACGIDVLRIRPGHILLEGCEYGFIGGASFVCEKRTACDKPTVYFFGTLDDHPDRDVIVNFISKYGYRTVSLGGTLCDFGGAVII